MRLLARLSPRHGAAIAAGLLLALSFPKPGIAGLAWVAPGFLLFAALGRTGGECFWMGYLAGLTHYLVTLYWLLFIPFPAGAVAGWLALSAYLALYPATWVWLCWKLFPVARPPLGQRSGPQARRLDAQSDAGGTPAAVGGTAAVAQQVAGTGPAQWAENNEAGPDRSWWAAAGEFFTTHWWQRAGWTVLCAALWVTLEMVVARFLSGFPWNLLGASQYRILPLIQVASVTGVYGVSFLVVWFSASLVIALLRVLRQPGQRWGWLLELRLALLVFMAVSVFGLGRLLERADSPRELKIALVQPSIPQRLIWDHAEDANRFDKIMKLSRLALESHPDVIIWPESSMPNFTEENFQAITNLIVRHKVWMILGADDADRRAGTAGGEADDYDTFNAAFLFSPAGRLAASYRKRHLVMFGEYLPLARRLPFLRRIIPIPGDFTPGGTAVPFDLEDLGARLAPLICFEDVLPALARESAAEGTDILLNLTNDGWFGEGAAQWQQGASAAFRAVENGLPLVRCTNNGLTCWIDARGRLREVLRGPSGDVYGPGFLIVKIPLPPRGQRSEPTVYRRHGDWFGWGCAGLTTIAFAWRGWRKPGVARKS